MTTTTSMNSSRYFTILKKQANELYHAAQLLHKMLATHSAPQSFWHVLLNEAVPFLEGLIY